MRVTISHITAAYRWLMTTMDGRELAGLERRATLGSCPTRVGQIERFDIGDYQIDSLRPDLLVTDSSSCPAPNRFSYHISSKDFPSGAFILLEGGIQIASPELCFWQMSYVLPLGELVKFGDALCGRYSYTLDNKGRLVKRETPLTTARRLEAFARSMGSPRVHQKVFRALKAIVDLSESPMESCSTILMCLKRQYGGFGFRKPVMGHVVNLDEYGKRLLGSETCRCDMYWPDANFDLEYDSDQEHGPEAATHDSLRRQAIQHRGIEIGELRRPQVIDSELFEATIPVIAKKIKHKLRKREPELEYKHALAYQELRRQIFSWERVGTTMEASPLRIGELDW